MADPKQTEFPARGPTSSANDVEPHVGDDSGRGASGVADIVRRALMAGVGAVFLTEEGIRKTVSELKLPKEAFAYLASQAEKTRNEGSRMVRKELRRFLNSDAFKQQMAQALSGLTLEIKAEVRLKPSATPKPDIDTRVRVKATPGADRQK